MIVTIYTADGGSLAIGNFDAETILELIADLQEAEPGYFFTLDLDEGLSQVFIQKRHVVRVDIDHQARTLKDKARVKVSQWMEASQRRAEARRGNLRVPPARVVRTREDIPPQDYEG